MAYKKNSNPNRWNKSFKKRLLSKAAEPGGSLEKIAQAYGVKVSQLLAGQNWSATKGALQWLAENR